MGWIKRILGSDGAEPTGNETAETLARMEADGDDLSRSRDIDFTHLFSSEVSAIAFLSKVANLGYTQSSHNFWEERSSWMTSIQVHLVPSLEQITRVEKELNQIAEIFEGSPDGWGCVEIVPSDPS